MTDRITAAVDQLGTDKIVKHEGVEDSVPKIEVRMGAILSLERIAQDSTIRDSGRDHVRVTEFLCACTRENSKLLIARLSGCHLPAVIGRAGQRKRPVQIGVELRNPLQQILQRR